MTDEAINEAAWSARVVGASRNSTYILALLDVHLWHFKEDVIAAWQEVPTQ